MIRITDIRMPLLACTVALSGAAFAAGAEDFAAADVNEDGVLSKEEFATTLEEGSTEKAINRAFKKADRVKNDELSLYEYLVSTGEQEAKPKKEELFNEADGFGDANLTASEYLAATQGKKPFVVAYRAFLVADTDEVTGISLEEWLAKKKKAPKGQHLAFDLSNQETVETPDTLSLEEFALNYPPNPSEKQIAKITAKFEKLDKDESGELSKSEWNPGAPKTPAP